MKLTVFGSTSRTGLMVIERALAEGHSIVAFARDPEKLDFPDADLTTVTGELDDDEAIDQAIAGSDAVISLLGPRGRSPDQPIAEGTIRIVESMKRHGVRRLVATATLSARDSRDRGSARFALMGFVSRVISGGAHDLVIETVEAVRASDLDWTVLRLPMLTSGEGTGRVRAGYLGQKKLGNSLNREDLVEFILDLVVEHEFIGDVLVVTN